MADLHLELGACLDKHLLLRILEFSVSLPENGEGFSKASLEEAMLQLLGSSGMVDYYAEKYGEFTGKKLESKEVVRKREEVLRNLEEAESRCEKLLDVIEDQAVLSEIMASGKFTLDNLMDRFSIDQKQVDALFDYAKASMDAGRYEVASVLLHYFRVLSSNEDLSLQAIWGKLACEIILENWDAAREDILILRDMIETVIPDRYRQLRSRQWLLHWSLFVFFLDKNSNGLQFIELGTQDKYLNTIQTCAPYLLRYLTVAIILNRSRKSVTVHELRRLVVSEAHNYSDPVTRFFTAVAIDYNFNVAIESLNQCRDFMPRDYFLNRFVEKFVQEASLMFFETYFRVHRIVDLKLVTDLLPDVENPEEWVVDLIRNARLDAKIDSSRGRVVMGSGSSSLYQKVIDKTRSIAYNTQQMVNALDKKIGE